MLGINPFDQPDVESAKIATRGLLDARPEPAAARVHRRTASRCAARIRRSRRPANRRRRARRAAGRSLPDDGYVAVQAYVDRVAHPAARGAARTRSRRDSARPVTFGWGPRFLHSTGQFHKGGPADRRVPADPRARRTTTWRSRAARSRFGQLIQAQAAGDASVLAEHGRPVLTPARSPIRGRTSLALFDAAS